MSDRFEQLALYAIRTLIVGLWLAAILAFLYSPYISQFFSDSNSINIYTWADIFNEADIIEFQKQTGIKANLVYYDNSEELLTKLEFSKGHGFDLLLSGDSNLPELIKMGILAPIDHSRLDFWHQLEPQLLNLSYDPGNRYSIPVSWDVYGLGVNLAEFSDPPRPSWKVIFDPKSGARHVGMMEEGLRSVMIAAQYLYGNVSELSEQQIREIRDLLIKQKKLVVVYTELLANYLLYSNTSPVVATQAAYVRRVIPDLPQASFIIPDEGGFIATENLNIFAHSKKRDLVYKFINFMFQKDLVKKFAEKTAFLPTRADVLAELDLDYLGGKAHVLQLLNIQKITLFRYIIPREVVSRIWIEVKAS